MPAKAQPCFEIPTKYRAVNFFPVYYDHLYCCHFSSPHIISPPLYSSPPSRSLPSAKDPAQRLWPGSGNARAAIEWSYELRQRGNSITVRWTPAHVGVEGNEYADALAKRAAEGRADPEYLGETSLSHLTRKTTKARSEAAGEWIWSHVRKECRYRPPPRGKLRKGVCRVREELAGCFYQLLSGNAATATHLRRVGQPPTTGAGGAAAASDSHTTTC